MSLASDHRSVIERIKTLHQEQEVENQKDLSPLWDGLQSLLTKIADKTVTGEYKLCLVLNQGGLRDIYRDERASLKK